MVTRVRRLAAAARARFACAAGGERSGRRTFLAAAWLGAVSLLRAATGLGPRPALGAQLPGKGGSAPSPRPGGLPGPAVGDPPFRVSVRSLVVEGGSKPGETVTVRMTVDTLGKVKATVPWTLYRGNAALRAGTQSNVEAGTSFEVSATWQALAGTHTFHGAADPQNTLRESPPDLRDNLSQTVTRTFSDWPRWIEAAKRGVGEGFPRWVAGLKFTGIAVNGPIATGGRLEPTVDFRGAVSGPMRSAGAPSELVENFMGAVADAYGAWAAGVRVPGLPWFPALAAFPGPVAPPLPNIPTPLAVLTQDSSALQPPNLSAAIRTRLRDAATWPGAAEGIEDFCRWAAAAFTSFVGRARVVNVLGKGPVPTFAPPYVPVGPVVGGDNIGAPGNIAQ